MTRSIGVLFGQRAARLGILLGILIGMLLFPGCRTARMPLPETLAATERMPVSGRQGLRLKRQELSLRPVPGSRRYALVDRRPNGSATTDGA
jgi:hypothetical protein